MNIQQTTCGFTRRRFLQGMAGTVLGAGFGLSAGLGASRAFAAQAQSFDEPTLSDSSADVSADSVPNIQAVNPTTLWAGWVDTLPYPPSCMVETNLGDVAAESFMRAASDAIAAGLIDAQYASCPIVALERGGNLRGSLARGVVSTNDIDSIVDPMGTIGVVAVTPQELFALFESIVATLVCQDSSTGMLDGMPSGDTPQLAGLIVTCDPSLVRGSRITCLELESGGVLDPSDTATQILLATNDYALSGATPYEVLTDHELLANLGSEAGAIKSFIANLMMAGLSDQDGDVTQDSSVIDEATSAEHAAQQTLGALPVIAGARDRLRFEGAYQPHDWDATILIVDEMGSPLADTALSIVVDAYERQDLVSDADGYISVHVSDGPHAIYLVSDADNQLTDNILSDPSDSSDLSNAYQLFDPSEQTRSNRLDAATRALEDRATNTGGEIYINNYLGVGLIEDDVRTFPTLTVIS